MAKQLVLFQVVSSYRDVDDPTKPVEHVERLTYLDVDVLELEDRCGSGFFMFDMDSLMDAACDFLSVLAHGEMECVCFDCFGTLTLSRVSDTESQLYTEIHTFQATGDQ